MLFLPRKIKLVSMFQRKITKLFSEWRARTTKKALCIVGARQIGKTTAVREFGKSNYAHFVELNFAKDERAKMIFEGSLDVETVLTNLTAYVQKPLVAHHTLILFDEVQECPRARTAIKFLVEDGRYDYMETGSLLGVRTKEVVSQPVGFEEIVNMYPMDFEEFLWANGVQPTTIDYLRACIEKKETISDSVHDTMSRLFLLYLIVGGMPDVVGTYVGTKDIGRVVAAQKDILALYRLDIAKYSSSSERQKINRIFDSLPGQLNDRNRRFVLTDIDDNGRMNRYANSFQWLVDAGVALPCYNVSAPQMPLVLNEKYNLFKLYLNDTGLLCAASLGNVQYEILNGNVDVNLGSVLENAIAQELVANGFSLHYFNAKKYGELDFVLQDGAMVMLVEAKSGKFYKSHAALDNVLSVKEWSIGKSVVLCKGNVEEGNGVVYLPWYAVMFIRPPMIPYGSMYQVDVSGL